MKLLILLFFLLDCKNEINNDPCSVKNKNFWSMVVATSYTKSSSSVCNLKLPESNKSSNPNNPTNPTNPTNPSIPTVQVNPPFYRWQFNNVNTSSTANALIFAATGTPTPTFDSIQRREGSHSMFFNPGNTATGPHMGSQTRLNLNSFDVGNQFSISVWFNFTELPAYTIKLATIFSNKLGSNGSDTGFAIHLNEVNLDNRNILISVGNGSLATEIKSLNNVFNYSTWNHLSVTFDRTLGVARVYLNGAELNLSPNATILTNFATNQVSRIGALSTGNNFCFSGNLDDFRFYNYVLTPAQVTAIFNESL
jgi:hypothetical protein